MPGNSPSDGHGGGVSDDVTSPTSPTSPISSPATSPAPADTMESQRRLSTSSDASSSGLNDSAHKVDSTMDYIPTRMTKVSTPKPAANPLQFVKVGPCDLFKSAQETLKKVEEVKKMKKEVRDEAEDWQSNLDNWKCSRRKRVEHIIDRVVEVKKFELEEHERNRRKAKTFSEMMEERSSKGRKMSLLIHKDDDSNDLSDLGIGTSSDKSSVSEDYTNDDNHSVDDGEVSVKSSFHEQNGSSTQNGESSKMTKIGLEDDASTNTTISSPEPEEYTYDRAIQGYVNFTETRVKSRIVNHVSRAETEIFEETSTENSSLGQKPLPSFKSRRDSKVEEDIADIERRKSGSINDLQNPEKKLNVPKVDISKRKELFERSESSDSNEQSKVAPRAVGDLANSKSIRDRVSNLERQKSEESAEKSKQVKQLASEISVKDRLSLLERQQSFESQPKSCSSSKLNVLVSPGEVAASPPPSIKDRLSSLEQVSSQDRPSKICMEITPNSIKNRLSELELPKEAPKKVMPDRDPSFRNKLENFTVQDLNSQHVSKPTNNSVVDSARFSSPDEDEFYRKRTFHRSLDSLEIDSSSVLSNEPYERVQSLEDLDSCGTGRHYPASASSNENLVLSCHSGDTDREDSGIHTADVSCSVSQADEPADIGDINMHCNGGTYMNEGERNMEYAPPTIVSQLAKINLTESVPHDKVSSRPEVVSPEAICSNHSQVLVDLPNPYSSSKPVTIASKTFSSQLSSLPTIPEVSHDCPPAVFVSDTEPITPATCTEAAFSPFATSSPLESGSLSECTDKTETANQSSQAVVMVSDNAEGKPIASQDESCMSNLSADKVCIEEVLLSHCGGLVPSTDEDNAPVNLSTDHPVEVEKDVMDVSVSVVTENSIESDPRLDIDKGPKPYCLSASSKDSQSLTERDLSSVTSAETDTDVGSFLDQALMEEDLKMGGSGIINRGAMDGSVHQLHPMHSVAKNDDCLEARATEINVLPLAFPLGTSNSAEPPKEKPPPPPVELSDDEDKAAQQKNNSLSSGQNQKCNLGRLDSTKRIKKDNRRKRSDFLGIEGSNDDSYLDCEMKVAPPPDMTSFLQEERRLEQELYRQMQPTLYPESDHGSNQGESRDSGVELDNHLHSHNLHTDYSHEDQSCENHSRQNSEPFGNASSTSEEDEIIKKEREIIEILEKEEQWRYGTNTVLSPSDHHQVGEKLAAKLRELEQEKMRLEWERAEESRKAAAEHAARQEDQRRIRMKEEQLRQQERIVGRLPADVPFNCDPSDMTPEALREEREQLKQEQAELERQREMLAANQVNGRQSWNSSSSSTAHRSLQDVSGSPLVGSHSQLNVPTNNTPLNYRLSLPDLQQSDVAVHPINMHHHRPPPPIPPAKPLSIVSQERHSVNGISRQGQLQSSSDSLSLSSDSHHHRHNAVGLPSVPAASSPTSSTGSQQMTRQTLHALSAAPRSKIIATDTWVQAKRKPESQRNNNRDHYQHWLIQEAEHRRITEQQQRNAASRKSLPPNLSQSQHLQSKPIAQPVQPQQPQAWQYQHPHHQPNMHQISHQHQHLHHSHPHSHAHPQLSQSSAPPVPPPPRQEKPLPDAIIQTLTQRVQNRASMNENNRRHESSPARESRSVNHIASNNMNNNNCNNTNMSNININHNHTNGSYAANSQEKMLSVSGKKKCSHCNEELGRGAAMIIESLRLFYHMDCFKCCVCHIQLGDGLMGTDVRVRNHKLHCHNCYSSDDGVKFSCV